MSNQPKFTAFSFDASTVAPAKPMEPVPADFYPVAMTDGEIKPTADGSGLRLNFELTIQDGPCKGRKVWDGLNIKNNSAQAQEISHQQLSAICHATGVIRLQDVQELFNKPFTAKIGYEGQRIDEQTGKTYEARNTFKGAKPLDGAAPAGAAKPAAGAAAPAWLKKPAPGAAPAAPATAPAPAAPAATPPPPATPPFAAKAPAAPAAAKAPAAPKAAAKPARKFFVAISETELPLKTEAEVAEMLTEGMPGDTMLSLAGADDGFVDDNGWKPASSFNISSPAPAAATPAGAPVPPWKRK